MSDLEFIAPVKTTTVAFSLNPVQNAIADLVMLTTTDTSGFADWVTDTAAAMPDELLEITQKIVQFVWHFVDDHQYSSFPEWLDQIASRDPHEIRDEALDELLSHARSALGDLSADIPDATQVLENQEAYDKLMELIYQAKGKPFTEGCCDQEYDFFQDPASHQKLVVDHLGAMWEKYLEPEWERNITMLQESISAFEKVDFSGKSLEEILRLVADREIPEKWEGMLSDIEQVLFVPSPHIGPYLIAAFRAHRMQVIFGARVPRGTGVPSPALSRSELITRLNALADDTRLRILDLLAKKGEAGAQEIIAELSLSQSAASRHLRQLTATGYLVEQRREGGKYYLLNQNRIDDAFNDLKEFLG